ncbi:MAG TPA: ABC transporter ATP-binding protein [Terriglobales bacterium]|nr:ABC transporter ATP-binding protein [Terriglobales bacterium]
MTTPANDRIIFDNVSKFYGDVLGVNRVTLSLPPGITSLVGPNGSGKTTLMNLMTGLVQPTRGHISVLGLTPESPAEFFRVVGYCTQFDSFPKSVTGYEFVYEALRLHGLSHSEAAQFTGEALHRVGLTEAAHRKIAGYSKGMRQKIRLAHAIAHHPTVLVLDEPLNGLDPMARAESLALFDSLGKQGLHVILSSHILEEVDRISDRVVLMTSGYVVAEGNIHAVRREVNEQPMQILIRCSQPAVLASRVFELDHAVEAKIHADGKGLLVRTRDVDQFYDLLNRIGSDGLVQIDAVAPADDDVNSIYQYLIGSDGGLA